MSELSVAYKTTNLGDTPVTTAAPLPVTMTGAGTGTSEVVGDVAHDAAASAVNPVLVGGYASAAAPTDVSTTTDAVRAWHLLNGAQAVVLTAAGALIGGDASSGLRTVAGKATVIAVTPVVDASALDANDTVFDATAITNAARVSGLGATLMAIDVVCQADQKAQLTFYFFDASVTFGTSDAAPGLSDADALKYLGHVDIAAADYDELGGVSVAQARNLSIPMLPASGTSLYVAATTTGTPTYGAADALKLRFHFLQD
jgi:hypothetical protein